MPVTYTHDDLEKVHQRELTILAAIDRICRDERLDYQITGGTCLGAVRHGGFIPWDDDIDVFLPEDDYFRFIEVAPRLLPEGMSLHTALNTHGFAPLWAKVWLDDTLFMDKHCIDANCKQGLFVDVFPFFRLDKEEGKAKLQRKRCLSLQQRSYFHWYTNPAEGLTVPFPQAVAIGCAIVHHTIARWWSSERLYREFCKVARSDNPGDLWFTPTYANWGPYPHDVLFPSQDIAFEMLTVRGPANPAAYLTLDYGDYMTLPPEDKRHTHAPTILKL